MSQTDIDLLRTIAIKEIGHQPLFFYYKCSSCGYQCVCQILYNSVIAFKDIEKPKLPGHMMGWTDVKTEYPLKHSFYNSTFTKNKYDMIFLFFFSVQSIVHHSFS